MPRSKLPCAPKNDLYRVQDRRVKAATLYKEGLTQHEIAARLGCSQFTVHKDLAASMEEWKSRASADWHERAALELARLDDLSATAWAEWKQSKLGGRLGNPRYLETVLKCIALRLKVLGLLGGDQTPAGPAPILWDSLLQAMQAGPAPLSVEQRLEAMIAATCPALPAPTCADGTHDDGTAAPLLPVNLEQPDPAPQDPGPTPDDATPHPWGNGTAPH